MRHRYPAQAGTFYSSSRNILIGQIEGCFLHRLGPGRLPCATPRVDRHTLCVISPHAGYMYSGPVAAHAYYRLATEKRPDSIVILGPNHTGYGSAISAYAQGAWRTPLGDIETDSELVSDIIFRSGLVDADDLAHKYEHSIEVQLPFLQYVYGNDFKLAAISMMIQDLATSTTIGEAIASALAGRNALIIASTDMTHYRPAAEALAYDRKAIDSILSLDAEALIENVEKYDVSMCGYGPVSAALVASKILGGDKAELLSYATSGDITNDHANVVGYASIAVART